MDLRHDCLVQSQVSLLIERTAHGCGGGARSHTLPVNGRLLGPSQLRRKNKAPDFHRGLAFILNLRPRYIHVPACGCAAELKVRAVCRSITKTTLRLLLETCQVKNDGRGTEDRTPISRVKTEFPIRLRRYPHGVLSESRTRISGMRTQLPGRLADEDILAMPTGFAPASTTVTGLDFALSYGTVAEVGLAPHVIRLMRPPLGLLQLTPRKHHNKTGAAGWI